MNKKTECVELQSRMLEFFANPQADVPEGIETHLETCPECKLEFTQMTQALELIKDSADLYEDVPEALLESVEAKLESTEQLKPALKKSNKSRNILILQYSYLSSMAVIIWLSILLIQPMFISWLAENGLTSASPILVEYGLFLAFFATGGLFALISSPLIIKTARKHSRIEKKYGFFRRLFSSGLRIFAC